VRPLRWATGQLAQSSRESARLEAELIVAHVLQKARHELYLQPSHTLSHDEQTQLYELVERRGRGEPLQYLLEYTEFYGCLLRVTPAVLIPRPETEELVEFVLQSTPPSPKDVLDLGTGSGAIAIALARAWPEKLSRRH
jgi:release factor glutamine methyltransferase